MHLRNMYTFRFLLLAIQPVPINSFLSIFPFYSMTLKVYSFAFNFVYIQLTHKQSSSVPKMNLNYGVGTIKIYGLLKGIRSA